MALCRHNLSLEPVPHVIIPIEGPDPKYPNDNSHLDQKATFVLYVQLQELSPWVYPPGLPCLHISEGRP